MGEVSPTSSKVASESTFSSSLVQIKPRTSFLLLVAVPGHGAIRAARLPPHLVQLGRRPCAARPPPRVQRGPRPRLPSSRSSVHGFRCLLYACNGSDNHPCSSSMGFQGFFLLFCSFGCAVLPDPASSTLCAFVWFIHGRRESPPFPTLSIPQSGTLLRGLLLV